MKDYMKIYREWLSNPYFDEDTKAELKAIEHDETRLKNVFIWIWSAVPQDCAVLSAPVLTA